MPSDAVHRLLTPVDHDLRRRVARLHELGLGAGPDPDFDAFACTLAGICEAPYAMVNLITETEQYFAGLYTPSQSRTDATHEAAGEYSTEQPGRAMAKDHGFCPHVVDRGKALVLDDVCDYPRFHGNPVVDEIGIRSYIGAPLIDRTGTTLGTVCVVDTQPRPWGRSGLNTIKTKASELMDLIHQREQSL